jgi:signal peptidase I
VAARAEPLEERSVKDPYEVLGVPRGASDAQIRYAYRQLTRESTGDSKEIDRAYKLLSDPKKRASYDTSIAVVPPPDLSPPAEETLAEPEHEPAAPVEAPPRNPITRFMHRLPRRWRILLDWVVTIAGAVLIVLAIKAWVVNPYRIPSSSMEPTLHCARGSGSASSGCLGRFSDRVLANRFIFHFRRPHRGEIIVFKTPPKAKIQCGAGGTFVKRLIGLPGDRIRERDGLFFIDGKRLDDSSWVQPARRDHETGFWVVPKGKYFFVGDNRAQSCDSRRWGAVPRGNLIGPVFATYWPPNRISVSTPGPVGGVILGILGVIILGLVLLGVRRRRVR